MLFGQELRASSAAAKQAAVGGSSDGRGSHSTKLTLSQIAAAWRDLPDAERDSYVERAKGMREQAASSGHAATALEVTTESDNVMTDRVGSLHPAQTDTGNSRRRPRSRGSSQSVGVGLTSGTGVNSVVTMNDARCETRRMSSNSAVADSSHSSHSTQDTSTADRHSISGSSRRRVRFDSKSR